MEEQEDLMDCTQRIHFDENIDSSGSTNDNSQVGSLHILGTNYPIYTGQNVIGRDGSVCSIVINKQSVSAQHALIEAISEKDHLLVDQGSSNGTRLGTVTLIPNVRYHLFDGAQIKFADVPATYISISPPKESNGDFVPETPYAPSFRSFNLPSTIGIVMESPSSDTSFVESSQQVAKPASTNSIPATSSRSVPGGDGVQASADRSMLDVDEDMFADISYQDTSRNSGNGVTVPLAQEVTPPTTGGPLASPEIEGGRVSEADRESPSLLAGPDNIQEEQVLAADIANRSDELVVSPRYSKGLQSIVKKLEDKFDSDMELDETLNRVSNAVERSANETASAGEKTFCRESDGKETDPEDFFGRPSEEALKKTDDFAGDSRQDTDSTKVRVGEPPQPLVCKETLTDYLAVRRAHVNENITLIDGPTPECAREKPVSSGDETDPEDICNAKNQPIIKQKAKLQDSTNIPTDGAQIVAKVLVPSDSGDETDPDDICNAKTQKFIKHKPTLPNATSIHTDETQIEAKVLVPSDSGDETDPDDICNAKTKKIIKHKPTLPNATSIHTDETQIEAKVLVPSDSGDETDPDDICNAKTQKFIKHKPTLPNATSIHTDETQIEAKVLVPSDSGDETDPDDICNAKTQKCIKHKPTLPNATSIHTDETQIEAKFLVPSDSGDETDPDDICNAKTQKFIKHKPALPNATSIHTDETQMEANVLVPSDLGDETDPDDICNAKTQKFIKHKPALPNASSIHTDETQIEAKLLVHIDSGDETDPDDICNAKTQKFVREQSNLCETTVVDDIHTAETQVNPKVLVSVDSGDETDPEDICNAKTQKFIKQKPKLPEETSIHTDERKALATVDSGDETDPEDIYNAKTQKFLRVKSKLSERTAVLGDVHTAVTPINQKMLVLIDSGDETDPDKIYNAKTQTVQAAKQESNASLCKSPNRTSESDVHTAITPVVSTLIVKKGSGADIDSEHSIFNAPTHTYIKVKPTTSNEASDGSGLHDSKMPSSKREASLGSKIQVIANSKEMFQPKLTEPFKKRPCLSLSRPKQVTDIQKEETQVSVKERNGAISTKPSNTECLEEEIIPTDIHYAETQVSYVKERIGSVSTKSSNKLCLEGEIIPTDIHYAETQVSLVRDCNGATISTKPSNKECLEGEIIPTDIHAAETQLEGIVQAESGPSIHEVETQMEEMFQSIHEVETQLEEIVQAEQNIHEVETQLEEIVQAEPRILEVETQPEEIVPSEKTMLTVAKTAQPDTKHAVATDLEKAKKQKTTTAEKPVESALDSGDETDPEDVYSAVQKTSDKSGERVPEANKKTSFTGTDRVNRQDLDVHNAETQVNPAVSGKSDPAVRDTDSGDETDPEDLLGGDKPKTSASDLGIGRPNPLARQVTAEDIARAELITDTDIFTAETQKPVGSPCGAKDAATSPAVANISDTDIFTAETQKPVGSPCGATDAASSPPVANISDTDSMNFNLSLTPEAAMKPPDEPTRVEPDAGSSSDRLDTSDVDDRYSTKSTQPCDANFVEYNKMVAAMQGSGPAEEGKSKIDATITLDSSIALDTSLEDELNANNREGQRHVDASMAYETIVLSDSEDDYIKLPSTQQFMSAIATAERARTQELSQDFLSQEDFLSRDTQDGPPQRVSTRKTQRSGKAWSSKKPGSSSARNKSPVFSSRARNRNTAKRIKEVEEIFNAETSETADKKESISSEDSKKTETESANKFEWDSVTGHKESTEIQQKNVSKRSLKDDAGKKQKLPKYPTDEDSGGNASDEDSLEKGNGFPAMAARGKGKRTYLKKGGKSTVDSVPKTDKPIKKDRRVVKKGNESERREEIVNETTLPSVSLAKQGESPSRQLTLDENLEGIIATKEITTATKGKRTVAVVKVQAHGDAESEVGDDTNEGGTASASGRLSRLRKPSWKVREMCSDSGSQKTIKLAKVALKSKASNASLSDAPVSESEVKNITKRAKKHVPSLPDVPDDVTDNYSSEEQVPERFSPSEPRQPTTEVATGTKLKRNIMSNVKETIMHINVPEEKTGEAVAEEYSSQETATSSPTRGRQKIIDLPEKTKSQEPSSVAETKKVTRGKKTQLHVESSQESAVSSPTRATRKITNTSSEKSESVTPSVVPNAKKVRRGKKTPLVVDEYSSQEFAVSSPTRATRKITSASSEESVTPSVVPNAKKVQRGKKAPQVVDEYSSQESAVSSPTRATRKITSASSEESVTPSVVPNAKKVRRGKKAPQVVDEYSSQESAVSSPTRATRKITSASSEERESVKPSVVPNAKKVRRGKKAPQVVDEYSSQESALSSPTRATQKITSASSEERESVTPSVVPNVKKVRRGKKAPQVVDEYSSEEAAVSSPTRGSRKITSASSEESVTPSVVPNAKKIPREKKSQQVTEQFSSQESTVSSPTRATRKRAYTSSEKSDIHLPDNKAKTNLNASSQEASEATSPKRERRTKESSLAVSGVRKKAAPKKEVVPAKASPTTEESVPIQEHSPKPIPKKRGRPARQTTDTPSLEERDTSTDRGPIKKRGRTDASAAEERTSDTMGGTRKRTDDDSNTSVTAGNKRGRGKKGMSESTMEPLPKKTTLGRNGASEGNGFTVPPDSKGRRKRAVQSSAGCSSSPLNTTVEYDEPTPKTKGRKDEPSPESVEYVATPRPGRTRKTEDCKVPTKTVMPGKRSNVVSQRKSAASPRTSDRDGLQLRSELRPHVLFTSCADSMQALAVSRLGGVVADSPQTCTVFVTDQIRRTCKLLTCVGKGIPVVSSLWLTKSSKCGSFQDPWDFLVADAESEKKFGFKLSAALKKSKTSQLLAGYSVFATPNVKPPLVEMQGIVEGCGGTWLGRAPAQWPERHFVVSCEEDRPAWSRLHKPVTIVATEFLLMGVLQQKLDFKKHALK